ncbi:helix-turn-helix transcriptional regulator [Bradyrhizobium sp. I71]|nr:helix-turn-helix transcriptional regulator [Bradyrhizobium sp. I71]
MPSTVSVSPASQEGHSPRTSFVSSHELVSSSGTRLNAGRSRRRAQESRLECAPPPNSIRFFRRRAGLSLEKVGKLIGVTRETIRRLEERDTWLDAERAFEIGLILGVPKEALGFSYAQDAYGWAARVLPVVGSIGDGDEVMFEQTSRCRAGAAHLPAGSVALEIRHGKMRGWLLVYNERSLEPMTADVLSRQGANEYFISHITDGTTWWRHISPAAEQRLFHLTSRHLDAIHDVQIEWVAKIVAIQTASFELPTREQLSDVGSQ